MWNNGLIILSRIYFQDTITLHTQYLPLDFNAADSSKPLHLNNVTQHVILLCVMCYAFGQPLQFGDVEYTKFLCLLIINMYSSYDC